jgi:hypothetical protein
MFTNVFETHESEPNPANIGQVNFLSIPRERLEAPPTKREAQQLVTYMRRRAKCRFYADENFSTIAVAIRRRLGADVLTAHEARHCGEPDENYVAEALRLKRILITRDGNYLDERRFHRMTRGEIIRTVRLPTGSFPCSAVLRQLDQD